MFVFVPFFVPLNPLVCKAEKVMVKKAFVTAAVGVGLGVYGAAQMDRWTTPSDS